MPSWLTRAAWRASARKRSKNPGSPRYSSLRILMATVRPITRSVACHTSPMPPIATRLDSWYLPPKVSPLVGLICLAPPLVLDAQLVRKYRLRCRTVPVHHHPELLPPPQLLDHLPAR